MKEEQTITSIEYHLQFLDNGISLISPQCEFAECKEYSGDGRLNDKAMIGFIGKTFWEDIYEEANALLANDLKITITIEEDKK